jgi:hypothetical protein
VVFPLRRAKQVAALGQRHRGQRRNRVEILILTCCVPLVVGEGRITNLLNIGLWALYTIIKSLKLFVSNLSLLIWIYYFFLSFLYIKYFNLSNNYFLINITFLCYEPEQFWRIPISVPFNFESIFLFLFIEHDDLMNYFGSLRIVKDFNAVGRCFNKFVWDCA